MALEVLCARFCAGLRAEGLEPEPSLRLLRGGATRGGVEPIRDPWDLGVEYERSLSGPARSSSGAWYTPRDVARELVARAIPEQTPGVISDPACGGGAFLLAAGERMRGLGASPHTAATQLWGADTDSRAVAVAEAALWWWSAREGHPVVAGERLVVGDALTELRPPPSSAVVGNPPFLSQLKSRTAVDAIRRRQLQARFGEAVRPYTDPAWLFLLVALDALEPDGRAVLIQPTSLLAARDAGTVRSRVERTASVEDVWIAHGRTFEASVDVCAPTIVKGGDGEQTDWVGPLADALSIPRVELGEHDRLGSIATAKAGFRDEYYGLCDAVAEGGPGLKLVTAGDIDPFRRRAAGTPIRFAGATWTDPVVEPSRATPRARAWIDAQSGPKVLVATQTRVVEAVADPCGALLGSVPVIAVVPDDPADLWRVLAALHAPAASAWLMRRSSGTALSAGACKPTSRLLADLPLPVDRGAWEEAASHAQDLAQGSGSLAAFAVAAGEAYAVGPAVAAWWRARLPRRAHRR